MRYEQVKLSLNPANAEDRRIIDFLDSTDEPRSRVIKRVLLRYLDHADSFDPGSLFQAVKDAAREGVLEALQGGSLSPITNAEQREEVDPLAFLEALQ